MAGKKKSKGKGKKTRARPGEAGYFRRLLTSPAGKFLVMTLSVVVVTLLAALIAGDNLHLFLLLTGMALLTSLIVFWVLLLYRRATSRD